MTLSIPHLIPCPPRLQHPSLPLLTVSCYSLLPLSYSLALLQCPFPQLMPPPPPHWYVFLLVLFCPPSILISSVFSHPHPTVFAEMPAYKVAKMFVKGSKTKALLLVRNTPPVRTIPLRRASLPRTEKERERTQSSTRRILPMRITCWLMMNSDHLLRPLPRISPHHVSQTCSISFLTVLLYCLSLVSKPACILQSTNQ